MQQPSGDPQLLNVVVEQMRQPLLQIARQAELARLADDAPGALENIEHTAAAFLRILDNYLLSTRMFDAHDHLHLEPVSVSAVLNDAAHGLTKMAQQYDCAVELHLSGRYEPIMAHRAGLEAALTSLGYVFIEQQSINAPGKRPLVKMAAHRGRSGIVTGTFADVEGLVPEVYHRARLLRSRARQPLNQLIATSGAGMFVAESLLSSMSARLRVAHHQKMAGLAATFTPSTQTVLV